MARTRLALITAAVGALAGFVLLYFLARLVLSHDAWLIDHVAERRTMLVSMALWAGADPNFLDDDGRSALPVAVERSDAEIVAMLLDACADPNAPQAASDGALVLAVNAGSPKIVRLLLEAGADPNMLTADGESVLAKAVQRGDFGLSRRLLIAGADPNGPGVREQAARRRDSDIDRLLVVAVNDPSDLITGIEMFAEVLNTIADVVEGAAGLGDDCSRTG